jgi:Protein of unknown function (DUF3303)
MRFMLIFDWNPDAETRSKAILRFRNAGGPPPEGVKRLGRWTRADFSGGFDLLETDDAQKLFEFAYMWGDLIVSILGNTKRIQYESPELNRRRNKIIQGQSTYGYYRANLC